MDGLIGRKIGMTQVFDQKTGAQIAVTVIEAGPCKVLQLKTEENEGYNAVQVGFETIANKKGKAKTAKTPKAQLGHFAKSGSDPVRFVREFRVDSTELEVGGDVKVDIFGETNFVDVTGTSKGRGFQGVVKRYNFRGGRKTHGGQMHRRGGSIGQCVSPARVAKGRKMPGHMGARRITEQNLKVVAVRPEDNAILVRGAVPGPTGGLVVVKKALKK